VRDEEIGRDSKAWVDSDQGDVTGANALTIIRLWTPLGIPGNLIRQHAISTSRVITGGRPESHAEGSNGEHRHLRESARSVRSASNRRGRQMSLRGSFGQSTIITGRGFPAIPPHVQKCILPGLLMQDAVHFIWIPRHRHRQRHRNHRAPPASPP